MLNLSSLIEYSLVFITSVNMWNNVPTKIKLAMESSSFGGCKRQSQNMKKYFILENSHFITFKDCHKFNAKKMFHNACMERCNPSCDYAETSFNAFSCFAIF